MHRPRTLSASVRPGEPAPPLRHLVPLDPALQRRHTPRRSGERGGSPVCRGASPRTGGRVTSAASSPTRVLFGGDGNWRAEEVYSARVSTAASSPRFGADRWPSYAPADVERLEGSVLLFLFHLGVLRSTRPGEYCVFRCFRCEGGDIDPTHAPPASREPASDPPARITDSSVLPYIRNGTLVCRAALAAGAPRMLGTYECPRVAKTCLANIQKAFESLRELDGMSQVYLSAPEEVFKGNLRVILPLFEDVIKCAERRTPRRHRVQPGDRPYISPHFVPGPVGKNHDTHRGSGRRAEEERVAVRHAGARSPMRGSETGQQRRAVHPVPTRSSSGAGRRSNSRDRMWGAPTRSGSGPATPRSPLRGAGGVQQRRAVRIASGSGGRRSNSRDRAPLWRSGAAARSSSAPPRPQTPPRPHEHPQGSRPTRQTPRGAPRGTRNTPEKKAERQSRGEFPEEQQLRRWLQSVWPAAPPLEGHALRLWSDGCALAELVRRVEHDSSLLTGVVERATKMAQFRNNVNLVLQALNTRRHVLDGMSYLPDEVRDGVIAADPNVLWGLLSSVKRAYGCRGGQARRQTRSAHAEVAVLAPEVLGFTSPQRRGAPPVDNMRGGGRSRQPLKQGVEAGPARATPQVAGVQVVVSRAHPHARSAARAGTPLR
eukprot:Hpha_TRINITY_DN34522_c0_g1::TRINITY_DN34522_c0_g1_i1::g.96410::m.96410